MNQRQRNKKLKAAVVVAKPSLQEAWDVIAETLATVETCFFVDTSIPGSYDSSRYNLHDIHSFSLVSKPVREV